MHWEGVFYEILKYKSNLLWTKSDQNATKHFPFLFQRLFLHKINKNLP